MQENIAQNICRNLKKINKKLIFAAHHTFTTNFCCATTLFTTNFCYNTTLFTTKNVIPRQFLSVLPENKKISKAPGDFADVLMLYQFILFALSRASSMLAQMLSSPISSRRPDFLSVFIGCSFTWERMSVLPSFLQTLISASKE